MIQETTQRTSMVYVKALGLVLVALTSLMLAVGPVHAATTFAVTNINNAGAGSLRQAILDANANAGADAIRFNIPDDPNVEGNEVKTIAPTSLLPPITDQATVDGYTQPGASANTAAIGTNAKIMIELSGQNAGPFADGLTPRASNSVVRGLAINGFGDNGIEISAAAPTGVRIEGNFIGADPTGTLDRGNDESGVTLVSGGNITIGGASLASRNLISGNDSEGISLGGAVGGNVVQGNLIGTKRDGTTPLANAGVGVEVASSNNTVGGTQSEEANTISFNSLQGITVFSSTAGKGTGNRIQGNSVFANGRLGVDLAGGIEDANDRTLNDKKDADTGANDLQNFPVITSATSSGGPTTIKGTLNSRPKSTFTVQFYSNPRFADEGKTFLGLTTVTTNKKGKASFTFTAVAPVEANVTATAIDASGNTSEFSDPRTLSTT